MTITCRLIPEEDSAASEKARQLPTQATPTKIKGQAALQPMRQ
ncbi:MAG: hypothetical protein R2860_10150 [Desulfobacterales bacterium]